MNHAQISTTQREIEQLLYVATNYASMEVYDNDREFAKRIAVVPVNPKEVYHFVTLHWSQILSRHNCFDLGSWMVCKATPPCFRNPNEVPTASLDHPMGK